MADKRQIAKTLREEGMPCNCDLDNWEPERSTGHSHACRIHKATIKKYVALLKQEKEC